ncbi:MAG: porin family protein [Bradyrhizobium sp.]|nr:porin family protein [Bradyrhizobium sp.]
MALKAPPPAAPTWTGLYAGVNVGYGWGDSRTDIAGSGGITTFQGIVAGFTGFPSNFAFTDSASARLNGLTGGGQIGYNYQLNQGWVVGVEADLQAAGQSGNNEFSDQFSTPVCGNAVGRNPPVCAGTTPLVATAATGYEAKIDGFATVRGRVGYLIADQVMLYGTGGLAYGRVEINGNASIPSAAITGGPTTFVPSAGTFDVAKNNLGYSIGGGVEGRTFAWLPPNWTWKAEYLYLDLESLDSGTSFSSVLPAGRGGPVISPLTGTVALHSHFIDNIVRVGLNYKFGN